MMRSHFPRPRFVRFVRFVSGARLCLAVALGLFTLGCPHRSPVWSPDGKRMLLLGGAEGESMDKPGSRLWLVPVADGMPVGKSARRLETPAKSRFLAVAWLTSDSFLAFTTGWEDDDVVDESEAIWRVSTDGAKWSKVDAPRPSSELTMRRNPVVVRDGAGSPVSVAYTSADEKTVVAALDGGGVKLEIEQAQTVGVGPDGGFLVYRPDDETGDLELLAYGADLEKRWSKPFSHYAEQFGSTLGKKRGQIVFNDTSTSLFVPRKTSPAAPAIAVNFVFTDVSWNDGVQGFHALLDAASGDLLSVAGATCLPGVPCSTDGWAWSVQPTTKRNVKTGSVRSVALAKRGAGTAGKGEASIEITGAAKSALHGYALAPGGRRLIVVVNGPSTRILSFPVKDGKVTGEASGVTLP